MLHLQCQFSLEMSAEGMMGLAPIIDDQHDYKFKYEVKIVERVVPVRPEKVTTTSCY